jgi:hypothetical protein
MNPVSQPKLGGKIGAPNQEPGNEKKLLTPDASFLAP